MPPTVTNKDVKNKKKRTDIKDREVLALTGGLYPVQVI